jgi:hypothetical protein
MLPRTLVVASTIFLGSWTVIETAIAEPRHALVIGNSAYRTVGVLPNPLNDAKAVTDFLSAANFEVMLASDLTQDAMRGAIRDFAAKIAAAGPDSIALVYYAGHGLQVEGENFLVPVDANIEQETDVGQQALRLSDLMTALASTPSKSRIVLLDACRNNPFSAINKTAGRGLAIVDAPTGSIVAYATAPGSEAEDGAGRHSPYTAALLKIGKEPGLHIEQVFKRVRRLVHDATDARQTPWESSSLTGDFFFFPTAAAVAAAPIDQRPAQAGSQQQVARADPQPRAVPRRPRVEDVRGRPPREAYDMVIEEDAIEYYEEFLVVYPNDPFADRIRYLLSRRMEALAWRNAVVVNTPTAYREFAAAFSVGAFAALATRMIDRPRVRPIDPVIMPRVVAPLPKLRVALPPPPPPPPPRITTPVNLPGAATGPRPRIPGTAAPTPSIVTVPPKSGTPSKTVTPSPGSTTPAGVSVPKPGLPASATVTPSPGSSTPSAIGIPKPGVPGAATATPTPGSTTPAGASVPKPGLPASATVTPAPGSTAPSGVSVPKPGVPGTPTATTTPGSTTPSGVTVPKPGLPASATVTPAPSTTPTTSPSGVTVPAKPLTPTTTPSVVTVPPKGATTPSVVTVPPKSTTPITTPSVVTVPPKATTPAATVTPSVQQPTATRPQTTSRTPPQTTPTVRPTGPQQRVAPQQRVTPQQQRVAPQQRVVQPKVQQQPRVVQPVQRQQAQPQRQQKPQCVMQNGRLVCPR